jgi:hypothetical protein
MSKRVEQRPSSAGDQSRVGLADFAVNSLILREPLSENSENDSTTEGGHDAERAVEIASFAHKVNAIVLSELVAEVPP